VWGFRRQLMAPEENLQYIQTNIPINKQGDRFGIPFCVLTLQIFQMNPYSLLFAGASVWIDVDQNPSPNNPVVIVGAPMKKQDNPTEFTISAIKSVHISYFRATQDTPVTSYTFNHVFMCPDCGLYLGDRIVFSGTMPACAPTPQSGTFDTRTGVNLDTIYYVVGIVRKFSPSDTFVPEGFQIAYTYQGANVKHPNEVNGQSGGTNTWVNSANTAMVTVGDCTGQTAVTAGLNTSPNPEDGYSYGTPPFSYSLGCTCSTGGSLKMKIVRVNSAGGAYVWEKSGGTWIFRSRLSMQGAFSPFTSNILWEKSYFGIKRLTFATNLRSC